MKSSWFWFLFQRFLMRVEILIGIACALVVTSIAMAVFCGYQFHGYHLLVIFICALIGTCILGYDALRRKRILSRIFPIE
jgi:hypothetical protein